MTKPAKKLNEMNWAIIRSDYEEGYLSLEDIALRNGVGAEDIAAQAEKEHWPRYPDMQAIGLRGATVIQKLLGITPGAFLELEAEGVIKAAESGRYNPISVARAVIRHYGGAARKAAKQGNGANDALEAEKIKTEQQRQRLYGAKASILENAYIPVEDVDHAILALFTLVHDEFTGRSARLASEVVGITEVGEIENRLERRDRESVTAIADALERALSDREGLAAVETDSVLDSSALGRRKSRSPPVIE